MSKTAVVYARFSCSKQREASIDDQLRVCREYCEREDYDIVGVYCDYAMSGRTDERPEFQRMIARAGESDVVVVYMMDRFSRDPYDAPIYKKELALKGVRLVSAMENVPDTPEGMLLDKLLEGMAAMESMKTSLRTKRGMEGNAMKCLANGVRVYGYKVGDDGRYEIDPDEAPMVVEAFERRLAGESVNSIAKVLAAMGVKTHKGKPCGASMVEIMIRNEKYTGVYNWGDVRVEGGMPAIIDKETFEAVQKAPRAKRRNDERYREYPLAGKSTCMCGAALQGHSAHGRKSRYDYYKCGKNCGQTKMVRADVLEQIVVNGVRKMVYDRSEALRIARLVADSTDDAERRAKAKAAAEAAREASTKLDNMMKAVQMGISHPDMQAEIDKWVAVRETSLARAKKLEDQIDFDVEDFADFLQYGATLDDDTVLKAFVADVRLMDGYAVVTLNYRNEKNEPAHFDVDGFAEFCLVPRTECFSNRIAAFKGRLYLFVGLAA